VRAGDVELLSSHTPEAFGEFYERHAGPLAAYVGRRARRPEVVFDLVAETFARALEHRRAYDPRKGPAVAWLFAIARHLMADAERRGRVSDAARGRLDLPPIALDDAQLARVGERSRVDQVEALSPLPESQRIAVLRRVLSDQEYDDALPARVECSERVVRGPAPRRRPSPDPFGVLRDQLCGPVRNGRRGVLAFALAAVTLCIAAAAAAAVTLTGGEPSKPMTGQLASPSPGMTPSPAPSTIPRPNQPPSATGRPPGTNRRRAPNAVQPPSARPAPIDPTNYQIELMPDLTAGKAGWCVGVALRGSGLRAGGRGCGPAGPPGTHLIAAGGMIGRNGVMYAVVDRAVSSIHLSNGRRIDTMRDPGVAPWRVAIWDVDVLPGGNPPQFTLHDSTGRELIARPSTAGRGPLRTHKVNAKHPPRRRCAIRAKAGSDLRAISARLLSEFETLDVVRPSYLSCSTTVFYSGHHRYRAAVLLNAPDLRATAPPLPDAPNSISARRAGPGWLVVFGGRTSERERVLRSLRVTRP
jgi:RNA polymerase sigma-70 factor (ECF subfamily)